MDYPSLIGAARLHRMCNGSRNTEFEESARPNRAILAAAPSRTKVSLGEGLCGTYVNSSHRLVPLGGSGNYLLLGCDAELSLVERAETEEPSGVSTGAATETVVLPLFGPRPSLMIARESGTILVCQPLSA